MKKKIIAVLLAASLLGAAGCGDKEKSEEEAAEGTSEEEFQLTNKEGLVVAADVKNLEDYVKLADYKNLELETEPKQQATDEDADQYIENVRLNSAPVAVTEDRAVQEGDTVNIDYTGYIDGEAFEGGAAEDFDLRIGSGRFIEGFEEGLIGHKAGETVTVDAVFPDPYDNNPDLAGKEAQFEVEIHSLSEPPALTDQWAAEKTEDKYKTVEEYRAGQKEYLQQVLDSDYESQVKSDLFSKVVEASEIKEYPEDMEKSALEEIRDRIENSYASGYGLTLEEYYEQTGVSEEDAADMEQEMAEIYMDQNLITQAILNAEGIELDEAAYREELEKYAKSCGFENAEAMEKMYQSNLSVLKDGVLWNRACNVLLETAKITEKEGVSQETEAEG